MTALTIAASGGVLAARLPGARYLALGLVVPTGFALDAVGGAGSAHVAEHVATRRGAAAVEAPPALAAFTRCHATVFTTEALPEQAADAFGALAAVVTDAPVQTQVLDQERTAVRHELEVTAAEPTWRIGAAVAALLAPETGLAAEHAATVANIGSLSPAQVDGVLRDGYRPDRAVLAVVGDLAPDELLALAADAGFPTDESTSDTSPAVRVPSPGEDPDLPEAFGVSFLLPGPATGPVPPWASAVLGGLVNPRGPVASAVNAPPLAHSVMKCRYGWLASVVWPGAARPVPVDPGNRQALVAAARKAHLSVHDGLLVPTQVRDALVAQAEGTEACLAARLRPEFDEAAADDLARRLISAPNWWRLRAGRAELLETTR